MCVPEQILWLRSLFAVHSPREFYSMNVATNTVICLTIDTTMDFLMLLTLYNAAYRVFW